MKFGKILAASALVLALLPAGSAQSKAPHLELDTHHTPGTMFEYPYLQAWVGTVTGDIDGWIEWWIDVEDWTAWPYVLAGEPIPNSTHYPTMIVRVFDSQGGMLLLETVEHGTTTMANTSWRANGEVTFAHPDLMAEWEGRRVHEQGRFIVGPDGPVEGWSTFRLN